MKYRFAIIFLLLFVATPSVGQEVIDLLDGPGMMMYGGYFYKTPQSGDSFGWSVAVGDFDGDGYGDILAGTIQSDDPDDNRRSSGAAYIAWGGPRSILDGTEYDLTTDAAVTVYGARLGDHFGFAVESGDIDRDGYDDLVMASPNSAGPDGVRYGGEIYVLYGRPRSEFAFEYDLRDETLDLHIIGPKASAGIGGRYSDDWVSDGLVVGDVNGDGYDDVIFATISGTPSPGRASAGIVYTVLGRPRCAMPSFVDCNESVSAAHPDVQILGGDFGDGLGYGFAIGDLDGDGTDDLVTRAQWGDGENNLRISGGDVYGFWGRPQWNAIYDVGAGEFDFAIQGPTGRPPGYRMVCGDLDGDGRDDLVTMQILEMDPANFPPNRGGAGDFYVLFGKSRAQWPLWTTLPEQGDVWIVGADGADLLTGGSFATFTISMATGDRDGDGYDDLLIGLGGADGPPPPQQMRDAAGEAHLIRGRPRQDWPSFMDLRTDYDLVIYGAQGYPEAVGFWAYDALGWSSVMADIDGNGKDEMIVSSIFADGPNNFRPDCGEVHVLFDEGEVLTAAKPPTHPGPESLRFLPNYPNPVRSETTLAFSAPPGAAVSVSVYDARGQLVSRPVKSERRDCTNWLVDWVPRDDTSGADLASGIYFMRLEAAGEVKTRKLTVVR